MVNGKNLTTFARKNGKTSSLVSWPRHKQGYLRSISNARQCPGSGTCWHMADSFLTEPFCAYLLCAL